MATPMDMTGLAKIKKTGELVWNEKKALGKKAIDYAVGHLLSPWKR